MVKDSVQHGCGKNRITHHLGPLGDLLVGGKNDRRRLVRITDEGEEPVGLRSADRCVSDLIDDDQLCLFDVLQPEACTALGISIVEDLHKVGHPLKAYRVAAVDRLHAEAHCQHGLAEPRRARKNDVCIGVYPVQFPELPDLALADSGLQLQRIEQLNRLGIRREVSSREVSLSAPFISSPDLCFQKIEKECATGQLIQFGTLQYLRQFSGRVGLL